MPSQSPYTQVGFTSPVQSDKQLLGATATDTAHQFFLQSPLVKRGQSKAKPALTSPLLGTAATCPAFYSPSPFSGLLRALSVPCLGAAFSPCQAGNTSANMSYCRKLSLPFPQERRHCGLTVHFHQDPLEFFKHRSF